MTSAAQNNHGPRAILAYVGTAGAGPDEGIYIYRFDPGNGSLEPAGRVGGVHHPSFLAIHPNRRYLYALDEERSDAGSPARVRAFRIEERSGGLVPINASPTHGRGLCHLTVDRAGRHVLAVHYTGGSLAVLPIRDDGSLGDATDVMQHQGSSVHPRRQTAAHPHSIRLDAANRFAFVPDLGMDKVMIYRFDAGAGKLVPHEPPAATVAPGSGPRHFAFHPGGGYAYVINELASTVTAFRYDAERGRLTEVQTVTTLPDGFAGENWTAEVVVHPDGRFLYGSNRGHDSIAIFALDPASGRLTPAGHEPTQGGHPRHFTLDPTGEYLLAANRDSDTIVVFRIDRETGRLAPTGHVTSVPRPVCIQMMPADA